MPVNRKTLATLAAAIVLPLLAAAASAAAGNDSPPAAASAPLPILPDASLPDPILPTATGGAGLGAAMHFENSPYRGGGTRNDLVPIYVYDGKRVFLEAYRIGLKLDQRADSRLDVFLGYRFEGFPADHLPSSLAGMAHRGAGLDLGLTYQQRMPWGTLFGEVRHDVAGESDGNEIRVGYRYDWESGRVKLQPRFTLAARDARLNNYYFGVRPEEATALRPAYAAGGGINAELGVSAVVRLSERWRLLAGVSATRFASGIRASPIVDKRTQLSGLLGVAYDFSPSHEAWPDGRPLLVKALYGKSTDCDFAKVMLLKCFSTHTVDQTRISAIEVGRPFIERLNDWPLDFVGYVGALHHDERGLQENSWQLNAYMKAYYYGFPWQERLRTRLGFGVGISYAQRVPFVEARDQLARGRDSSKLLNYLDLSADVNLGDLIGARSLRDTTVGLGVSHRSGIFGSSRLLGNVDGGSNYIYSYVEWRM